VRIAGLVIALCFCVAPLEYSERTTPVKPMT